MSVHAVLYSANGHSSKAAWQYTGTLQPSQNQAVGGSLSRLLETLDRLPH